MKSNLLFLTINRVTASIPGTLIYGRLSTVRFPKYQGVIPKEENTKIELTREVVRG